MNNSKRKQGTGEKVTAIVFVLCAATAMFIGMHKDALLEGRIMEVIASYLEA